MTDSSHAEAKLEYVGAQYLSGVLGRWTGADAPFADQHVSDPQSWNLYSYTRNNPLNYVDENGRELKIAIYNNSGFNRPSAERAGQHIVRKFEQAGVKNVTFEVRSGAPGLGAVAGAFIRSVGSFITGKQHSATLDLRSSHVSANGYAHDITPGRTGENESGIAAVDTSRVPQPAPGLVGPPDPAVEIGNLGAHEIAHDVFVGHPDDGDLTNIMHPSADPEVVTNPNLNFSPAQAEALRRRFNTEEEQRQMEEERYRP